MGFKKVLDAFPYFESEPFSGVQTKTSPTTNTLNLDNFGILIKWTGTLSGTITINASVDGITFEPLDFGTNPIAQPSGSPGSYNININQLPYRNLNVSYANASGSGNFTAKICGKDLN